MFFLFRLACPGSHVSLVARLIAAFARYKKGLLAHPRPPNPFNLFLLHAINLLPAPPPSFPFLVVSHPSPTTSSHMRPSTLYVRGVLPHRNRSGRSLKLPSASCHSFLASFDRLGYLLKALFHPSRGLPSRLPSFSSVRTSPSACTGQFTVRNRHSIATDHASQNAPTGSAPPEDPFPALSHGSGPCSSQELEVD